MVITNSMILSGAGAIPSLMSLLPDTREVLLVTDRNIVRLDGVQQIRASLERRCPQVSVIDNVPTESTRHGVRQLVDAPDDAFLDMVVRIGSSSMLDVAKLLPVFCHPQSPGLDALLADEKPTQQVQSWLTSIIAGTGSEATPNTVLAIPEQNTKVGITPQALLPDYVALFPELTTSMPAHVVASAGIDTPRHLLECFTAAVANSVSDNAALIGLSKLLRHAQPAVNNPRDPRAKLEVLRASYYDGVAITHTGTHLVRAFFYPLGGKYHLPHDVANAILLTPCMAFVRPWAVEKSVWIRSCIPDAEAALNAEEKSHVLAAWLQALVHQLKLPSNLADLDVSPEDIVSLNKAALNVKRFMSNMPCQLDLQDVQAIHQTLFPQHQLKE